MHPALSVLTPQCIAMEAFTNVTAAVARLDEIYERNTKFLRDRFEAYANGESIRTRVRATYPFVRITTATHARLDSRLSYGFVAGPGVYETTVTRPDLFRAYLTEQINLLIENHGVPVEIGESSEPIPVHFAYRRDINIEAVVSDGETLRVQRPVRDVFDTPDLAAMDDAIANGTLQRQPEPLALFRAARVDYSLHRLFHYTGTDPEHFQNFVIFTNYQFYVDVFGRLSHEQIASTLSSSDAFVEPGNVITRTARLGGGTSGVVPERMPQMPAFHLVEPGYRGITMINIGTGPSNARTLRLLEDIRTHYNRRVA
jgi:AMP nucleosidase